MKLKKYIWKYYKGFSDLLYALISFVVGAIPAVAIVVRARLIDGAVDKIAVDTSTFLLFIIVFCGIYLAEIILQAITTFLTERHGIKQSALLDYMRVEKTSRISFSVTEGKGFFTLLNKASKAPVADAEIYKSIGNVIRLAVTATFSVITIAIIDVFAAIGIVILLALGICLNASSAKMMEGFWERYIENTRRSDYFSSLLMQKEYAAERKIFSFDEEIETRYDMEFKKAKRQNVKSGRKRLKIETVVQVANTVYTVIMVLFLMRSFLVGQITIGEFISVFYAALQMLNVSKQLYDSVFLFIENSKRLNGFFDFMDLPEDFSSEKYDNHTAKYIEFKDVTFSYPYAKRPILNGISFTLECGKHYALVGENGCGKTTLVKLLLGLYKPNSGEILIDGTNICAFSIAERRKLFSAVFQDYYKYPLTMRENISLCSASSLSDGEITSILSSLDFSDAISYGKIGYDINLMPLKKDGIGLSGGQWQKLAVARCIKSEAQIAILDEPNSALDPVTEFTIYDAYRKMLLNKTTLFVSHRLGMVKMADEILVLQDGRLIAKAPHKELMSSCSYYVRLYNTQKEMYENE